MAGWRVGLAYVPRCPAGGSGAFSFQLCIGQFGRWVRTSVAISLNGVCNAFSLLLFLSWLFGFCGRVLALLCFACSVFLGGFSGVLVSWCLPVLSRLASAVAFWPAIRFMNLDNLSDLV
ncbi:hypothetical protein Ddye_023018 [Dipteronia dyeriana]|uniref:Uncharacterized protein n=1 Tax=Dipteronia dyeriana TaxID=168575 RepID=A0AAD9TS47_9ROSI|nr:hypothetical protein Ddye_023018 [Dipteronia dyeriana]